MWTHVKLQILWQNCLAEQLYLVNDIFSETSKSSNERDDNISSNELGYSDSQWHS